MSISLNEVTDSDSESEHVSNFVSSGAQLELEEDGDGHDESTRISSATSILRTTGSGSKLEKLQFHIIYYVY